MALAAPILITDTLVALCKESALSKAADAFRSYDASTELADLGKGRLDFVAPQEWNKVYASRSSSDQTCNILCFVRKKFERFEHGHAKQDEVDAWLTYVDELSDAAWAEQLNERVNARITAINIITPYDQEALKQSGLFLSLVSFSVAWVKAFR